MTLSNPKKSVVICLLIIFNLFIFRGVLEAKKPPNRIGLHLKLDVKVKWKKVGNQRIPQEMTIKNRTFPFKKIRGKYGVQIKVKDLMALSPEFNKNFNLALAEIGMIRIRELVGKDKGKAQEVFNVFKNKSSGKSGSAASTGRCNTQTMQKAYDQVLNSPLDLFPLDPLPFAENEDEEEEEDGGFFAWLAAVIFVAVVLFAPIVAAVWLAAEAVTLATVLTAFTASVASVTAAGTIAATLRTIDDVIMGKPLVEFY